MKKEIQIAIHEMGHCIIALHEGIGIRTSPIHI